MWTTVPGATLVPVPWRNGQGVTRDVLTRLAPDGSLDWQVSIADLAGETGFSDFTGYDRIFTPIAGEVELAFDGGAFAACPLLDPLPFAGERPVRCRVPGPARAFNAIARRPRPITVDVLRLGPGEPVPVQAGLVVLHCWSGSVQADGTMLRPGDSAHGTGTAQAHEASVVLCVTIP